MTVEVLRFVFDSVIFTTTDIESIGDMGGTENVYRNIRLVCFISK